MYPVGTYFFPLDCKSESHKSLFLEGIWEIHLYPALPIIHNSDLKIAQVPQNNFQKITKFQCGVSEYFSCPETSTNNNEINMSSVTTSPGVFYLIL